MKKKLLSILLCLCMVITLLPTVALAATGDSVDVWVGGVQMKEGYYLPSGNDKTTENLTTTAPASDGYAYFAVVDGVNTLTLHNFTHSGAGYYNEGSGDRAAVYANGNLTIVLEGASSLTLSDSSSSSYGISCSNLSIQGGGSLAAAGGTATIISSGIKCTDFQISGTATVTATGSGAADSSYGIYCTGGSATISGGTVNATGGTAKSESSGIYGSIDVAISGTAIVTATGGGATNYNGNSYGISGKKSVTISDSATVIATGGTSASSYGISSINGVTFSGGVTVARAGMAGLGGNFTSPNRYAVQCSQGTSITLTGTKIAGAVGYNGSDDTSTFGKLTDTEYAGNTITGTLTDAGKTATGVVIVPGSWETATDAVTLDSNLSDTTNWTSDNAERTHALKTNYAIATTATNALTTAFSGELLTVPTGKTLVAISLYEGADQNTCGIQRVEPLTIENNGQLLAVGGMSSDYVSAGIGKQGTLTLRGSGSTVAVGGPGNNCCGVWGFSSALTIESGTVLAVGGPASGTNSVSYSIFCENGVNISGGTGTAISGTATTTSQTMNNAPTFTNGIGFLSGAYNSKIAMWGVTHTHGDWEYELGTGANANKLTATCGATGCTDPAHFETLTINAPLHTTYGDGKSAEATLTSTADNTTKFAGKQLDDFALTIKYRTQTGTENGNPTYGEWNSTVPSAVGNHQAHATFTDETLFIISRDYTIAKAQATLTTTPTAKDNLTYNGTAQALITAGASSDGTVEYSPDGVNGWSIAIPTAADATSYTVYYKVVGDDNHNDSAVAHVTATIAPKPITITGVTAKNRDYDGTTAVTLTGGELSGVESGDAANVGFTLGSGTIDKDADTGKTVATAITLTRDRAGNYTLTQPTVTVDIGKKAASVKPKSFTVTANAAAPTLVLEWTGLVGTETLSVDSPIFKVTKSDTTEIAIADAVKTAGTYTITFRSMAGVPNVTDGTGEAKNYDVNTNGHGTLTVSNPPSTDDSYTPPLVTEIKQGGSTTADNLDQLISGKKDLTVTDTSGAKLVFDTAALKGIEAKTTGSVTVKIENVSKAHQNMEGKNVFSLTVESGNKTVTDFGGRVTVALPYTLKEGEKGEDVSVWYLASDGVMTEIPCTYDAKTGLATFTVTHFSEYVVGVSEWVNPFKDVKETDWFYDDAAFVAAKSLMSGTSATTFAPYENTSRGMIVTILYRLEGQPTVTGANPFDDVQSGKYYERAIIWAAQNGIVSGYGNGKFGPDDDITREQMAAILYRYAAFKGYDVSASADLSKFTDSGKLSGYAATAMSWANAGGLVTGKGNGILDPQGNAERCQVAAILHRFCENVVK